MSHFHTDLAVFDAYITCHTEHVLTDFPVFEAYRSYRDVGGWGRDPRKQQDFCTTVKKKTKNKKSNERWT